MGRMQSPATDRVSFSVDEEKLSEFDDLVDAEGYESRSAKLRELVEAEIGDPSDAPDEFVPNREVHAAVYRAAVDVCDKPGFKLRLDFYKGMLAQRAGVATDTVEKVLWVLQGAGYVSRMGSAPQAQDRRDTWHVKPLCADPDQWKHRKRT